MTDTPPETGTETGSETAPASAEGTASIPALELLPAVDVADGQAVRLVQGESGSETGYGDPVEAALTWQEQGAEWIHLVDLDAAFGRGHNREVMASVVERLDIRIELSGGIRDDESLDRALALGATRVNLGTAALEDPAWTARAIERHGEAIAVGLDVRGETLAARGWTREGGNLWEVLDRLEEAGCPRYVVTDVTKDGTLRGPNTELLAEVCRRTEKPVVASGGISSLDDVAALARLVSTGVEGAIMGKALYAGRFDLTQALRVAAESA
ncbi:MAG: bifunctional 1-(5-phosphoribosyl)-5-((5-phosphoribosylamino)methylideneamino)imidazole-4-carboxamide isomerase/phosphoribosylanthranilate isomerase PriA [Nesterenkonia sp.]|nr:bifunctional 1-(5-phosphoribosyl)-5-((5-phosphoribosylamino)methylideneamino)imidazole-4-carboxamide isomerase/phosphoribosylanthranilate isomerase PriA [Nesterenkonia sp.]